MAQNSIVWEFDLYIAGETPKSQFVYANLKKLCEQLPPNQSKIRVYNLLGNPKLAVENQITATPTIVRRSPLPEKILIGDLSNTESIKLKLGLK